jgi:hypothetical protein
LLLTTIQDKNSSIEPHYQQKDSAENDTPLIFDNKPHKSNSFVQVNESFPKENVQIIEEKKNEEKLDSLDEASLLPQIDKIEGDAALNPIVTICAIFRM